MIYGKLLGGGGPKSGSKCSGQNRRTAIMRFLVGCEEQELIVFMQMVFRVLNCQVQCKIYKLYLIELFLYFFFFSFRMSLRNDSPYCEYS